MNKTLLAAVGLGVLVVAGLIGSGLFVQRGARLVLQGEIKKTRTAALSDTRSAVVLDLRITNPSERVFILKGADIVIDVDGKEVVGRYVPEVDSKILFQGAPSLGEKYNPVFMIREKLPPKETVDRMAAATFDMPLSQLESRKSLKLVLQDVDGPKTEVK